MLAESEKKFDEMSRRLGVVEEVREEKEEEEEWVKS